MDSSTIMLIVVNIVLFLAILAIVFFRFIKPRMQAFQKDLFYLEDHIKGLQKKGWKDDVILKRLRDAGWDPKIIELIIHEVHKPQNKIDKLHRYIIKQQKKGRSKKQIRETLLRSKWKAEIVDLALGLRK